MILYIAGPMSGLPELNYRAFFEAEEQLKNRGYDTLNPARNKGSSWQDFMRAGITQVCLSDGVCLLDGWESSPGARLERFIAFELNLPFRSLENWLAP